MHFEPLESPFWDQGSLEEVTPNTESAVSIEEVKAFFKITGDDESAELLRVALQATRMVQLETGRAATSWAIKLHLDAFPSVAELPCPPLLTPSSTNPAITYVDVNGAVQTLSSTLYDVFAAQDWIRIRPAYGQTWPSTRYRDSAVRVAYTVGNTQANVPPEMKTAVLWKMKLLREDQLSGTVLSETTKGYDRIVNLLRRVA